MILAVGYRVNLKRGIQFRKWSFSILKDYLIEGYVVNNKRLLALNKTIEVQSKTLASTLDLETTQL